MVEEMSAAWRNPVTVLPTSVYTIKEGNSLHDIKRLDETAAASGEAGKQSKASQSSVPVFNGPLITYSSLLEKEAIKTEITATKVKEKEEETYDFIMPVLPRNAL